MSGISDKQVEYAVVDRLKTMLENPPKTDFEVTQSFALFSTVLLWVKKRAWVAGNNGERKDWSDQKNHNAHNVREKLRNEKIVEAPWFLSRVRPQFTADDRVREGPPEDSEINADFVGMNAEVFFKWLRDAIAHGDGQIIEPIHNLSKLPEKTLLVGFEIVFAEKKGSKHKLTLKLYSSDMVRIGTKLANLFCQSLSNGDGYFEENSSAASIKEVTRVV